MAADGGIFLVRTVRDSTGLPVDTPGEPEVLVPTAYESEDVLQRLLADYPAVLAGSTTTEGHTPQLLLVRREMGVPTSEGASATFSVDHLFLDPVGIPVIVEVKRARDTRIRREVVGQMLDYAANARKYWPIADLQSELSARAQEVPNGQDRSVEALLRKLHPDIEPDEFWRNVEANLKAGRVRMVFVADHLPDELVSIIEFLNEQMSPAEVLGVEVLRYQHEDTAVYVPHVVGATSGAIAVKRGSTRFWTEETFLDEATRWCDARSVAFFKRLFAHVKDRHGRLSWGKGVTAGVSGWYLMDDEKPRPVWTVNAGGQSSRGYAYFWPTEVRQRAPGEFDGFIEALRKVPALKSEVDKAEDRGWDGEYPSAYLSDLSDADLDTIFDALDGVARAQRLGG